MANISAGNGHRFMAAAPQRINYASGASIQEKELPQIERLWETVARLANGKPDVERAEKVLSVCITQFKAILEIPQNENDESYRNGSSLR